MAFALCDGSSCAECWKELNEVGKIESCSIECYTCQHKVIIAGGDRFLPWDIKTSTNCDKRLIK